MRFMRKAISLILILSFVFLYAGCGKSYEDAYIYFELTEPPETLDAQTAYSDSELMIVRNIYEGLMREDIDGEIVKGACKEYSVDGLSYIFKLRDKLTWSDGTALTAHDFVFGLRRAIDPKTRAPFAHLLYSISGAEAIAAGGADISTLGVEAIDKKTLKITLCREDPNFLKALTMSVAMPCNEEFFGECIGKYGLKSEFVISNGSYSITKWNRDEFGIRLYKNKKYNGKHEAQNAAVFISCEDEEAQIARLSEGNSDMAFAPSAEIGEIPDGLALASVQNKCWLLTIDDAYSQGVRKAFSMAFSGDVYEGALPAGFSVAHSLYPEILGVGEQVQGIGLTAYDISSAFDIMSAEVSRMEDKKFPTDKLYYYNMDGIKPVVTAIVGHWQQKLSAFINIEPSDSLSALQAELGEKTLPFSIFPITAKTNILTDYVRTFGSNTADAAELQTSLTSGNLLIPIAFEDTTVAYNNELENVVMHSDNGYIDFSYIIKYD